MRDGDSQASANAEVRGGRAAFANGDLIYAMGTRSLEEREMGADTAPSQDVSRILLTLEDEVRSNISGEE
jgi:hypothetical protein